MDTTTSPPPPPLLLTSLSESKIFFVGSILSLLLQIRVVISLESAAAPAARSLGEWESLRRIY
uniref:Uncharacterized protein n=1 Tax=Oryza punctata TaxID=4537 RepID=A0A0E0KYH5_ORYPU